MAASAIPATLITGFLGSGKTTLINRILRESHGRRIAVIENEFGAVGVDAEFLAQGRDAGDELILLANGCVCCTVRGEFADALYRLIVQSDRGAVAFDRLLVETTGLADPGPVLQTFLSDSAIRNRFALDGVITLVDALNAPAQIVRIENRAQIAYADRLLLTKPDLVDAARQRDVSDALARLNPRAAVVPCDLHRAPIGELVARLFETSGFALDHVPDDELLRAARGVQLMQPDAHGGRLRPVGLARHTADVVSCAYTSESPLDLGRLTDLLDQAVRRFGARLWRCKGVIDAEQRDSRLVLQGVHGVLKLGGGAPWQPHERRHSTLVFIGERLERDWLLDSLRGCERRD